MLLVIGESPLFFFRKLEHLFKVSAIFFLDMVLIFAKPIIYFKISSLKYIHLRTYIVQLSTALNIDQNIL